MRSCYHPDAADYHGPSNGDVESFISWGQEVCKTIDITQHLTGNQRVQIDGDVAWHEAYTRLPSLQAHRYGAGEQPAREGPLQPVGEVDDAAGGGGLPLACANA